MKSGSGAVPEDVVGFADMDFPKPRKIEEKPAELPLWSTKNDNYDAIQLVHGRLTVTYSKHLNEVEFLFDGGTDRFAVSVEEAEALVAILRDGLGIG